MKYCFIFFCVLVVQYGSGFLLGDGLIKPTLFGGCILESSATGEDIAEIRAHTFPTRRTGKCLLSCILNRMGLGLEEVKSRVENFGLTILQHLQETSPLLHEKVLPVMLRCNSEVDSKNLTDTCDFALTLAMCTIREGGTRKVEDIFNLIQLPIH